MAVIVTGGAGFIGSTLVRWLNERGHSDIWLVEAWDHPDSWRNLTGLRFSEVIHFDRLAAVAASVSKGQVEAVFHLGACTDTMETRLAHVLAVNTEFSQDMLELCSRVGCPLVYASSASVYGNSQRPGSSSGHEFPLNAYAFSKLLFDRHVQRRLSKCPVPVYGFRFFNVYGADEAHKGRMASMVYQLGVQARERGEMRLFKGFAGDPDGGQQRDFIHVDDVVSVLGRTMGDSDRRGIYDLGTGRPASFLEVAKAWQTLYPASIEFVECPDHVKRAYQRYTCADTATLASAGLDVDFADIRIGIERMRRRMEGER